MLAGAAGQPSVKIDPAKGIVDLAGDGQFVRVSWSGFPAKSDIYIRECVRGATQIGSECSQGGYYSTCGVSCPGVMYLGASDGQGKGSGIGQLAVGDINVTQSLDPIEGKTFTCDFEHRCSAFVLSNPFDLSSGVEVPITFSPPVSACPQGGPSLSGSGGSAGFKIFLDWAIRVCGPPQGLGLDYVLQSARIGMDDYIDGQSSDAVSPIPMNEEQISALKAAGRTAAYAPVAASSLVFGYRIIDQKTQSPVSDLVLTPDLLAKIFTGKIVSWGDAQIRKLNPGIAFPPTVVAVVRGDANEDTLTMTRWMWENAREAWIAGGVGSGIKPNPFREGPTEIIPSLGQVLLVTGANREVSVVGTGGDDFSSKSQYGLIGYMDASYAEQYKLSTVKIRFPSGKTVSATPATVARAVGAMQEDECGTLQADVSIQDPRVWPMPAISYAVIPHGSAKSENPPSAETIASLSGLLRFAVDAGQQQKPAGYVDLPAALGKRTISLTKEMQSGKPGIPPACVPGQDDPTDPDPKPDPTKDGDPPPKPQTYGDGTPLPGSLEPGPGEEPGPPGGSDPQESGDPVVEEILVPPQRPPMILAAAGAGLILPVIALLGLIALLAAGILLNADRLQPIACSVRERFQR